MNNNLIQIRRNDPKSLGRFAMLNATWIEDMHFLEESDKLMIAKPEIYIQNGNHVFSAHLGQLVIGAVALKKHKNNKYELTKMAVDDSYRNNGVGQKLITELERYAKEHMGLKYLFLLSNTRNESALRLYKRNGWKVNHEGPHSVYSRANIGMEKFL